MHKITHLTSVHPRYDTRIFHKMCKSLVKKYDVYLIVADGKGNEIKDNVKIFDVGKPNNRVERIFNITKKIFKRAKELDSDIYHLHDPELIPIGLKLKKIGKHVIFDAHEDVPKQIIGKPYLNKYAKILISKTFEIYEKITCKKFNYIITATPYIRDKFLKINKNSIDINNFPILDELVNNTPWSDKKNEVCYIGVISKVRGIKELVKAMELTKKARLNLAGMFYEKDTEEEVKTYRGWQKVNELGFLNRDKVAKIMSQSIAGIVTFYPLPNHINAQPNKMFEYMSAGLPIITSNFSLWKEIVEGNSCGICVNPLDPKEIAKAIDYIITHPKEAETMGKNGKKAILERYNWENEERKLLQVYKNILLN